MPRAIAHKPPPLAEAVRLRILLASRKGQALVYVFPSDPRFPWLGNVLVLGPEPAAAVRTVCFTAADAPTKLAEQQQPNKLIH